MSGVAATAFPSSMPDLAPNRVPRNTGEITSLFSDSSAAFMNYIPAEVPKKNAEEIANPQLPKSRYGHKVEARDLSAARFRRDADSSIEAARKTHGSVQLIPETLWNQQVEKVANGVASIADRPWSIDDFLALFRKDRSKPPSRALLKDFLKAQGVSQQRQKNLAWKNDLSFDVEPIRHAISSFKDRVSDHANIENINKLQSSWDELANHLALKTIPFVYKQDFSKAFHPDLNMARWGADLVHRITDIQAATRDQDVTDFTSAELIAWVKIRRSINTFIAKVKTGPQDQQVDQALDIPDCRFVAMALLNPTDPTPELAFQIAEGDLRGVQVTE
jgi:hypothetical protein